MTTVDVKDAQGEVTGSVDLNEKIYGIEPNIPVMHRTMTAQRASWRQGTANTRTRSDVSGGGRKPWRQKGTGRARQGSIRAPQWKGGGVVFGPHTRSYDKKVNIKEVNLAMRSALSAKLSDDQVIVVKDFEFEDPSTKQATAILSALDVAGKRTTIVVGNEDTNAILSFRNIPEVNVLTVDDINVYELIDNKFLIIFESCLNRIEEVLA